MAAEKVNVVGGENPARAQVHTAKPISDDEPVRITIQLRRNPAERHPAEKASLPVPARFLTRQELQDKNAATPDDIQALRRFADDHGLRFDNGDPATRLFILSGPTAKVSAAFGVVLEHVADERGTYRTYRGVVSVPDELDGIVTAVAGLHSRRARTRPGRLESASAEATGEGGLSPAEVAELYNFPKTLDGSGQTIAIIELGGGYDETEVAIYFQAVGLPTPAISVAYGSNAPDKHASANNRETALDIAVIGGAAPGARQVLYFVEQPDDLPDDGGDWLPVAVASAIAAAVHDTKNAPDILSLSIAGPETGSDTFTDHERKIIDEAFQDAEAMGMTVFAAAGDHGYTAGIEGAVGRAEYPATSPHAVACGGTALTVENGAISEETVWNTLQSLGGAIGDGGFTIGMATGGGISAIYSVPDYQSVVAMPASLNENGATGRGIPDVCANAASSSGYRLYFNGKWRGPVGGTSAVAPLWAALVACINQSLGRPVGPLHKLIYTEPSVRDVLRRVTAGSNGPDGGGYQARAEWDACTGYGSPDGAALLQAIKALPSN